jgi:hypothetical protein
MDRLAIAVFDHPLCGSICDLNLYNVRDRQPETQTLASGLT